MKTKLIAIICVISMMATGLFAYTASEMNTADALNELELFLGMDGSYNLDAPLRRVDGITLLVRMIGKEAEAKAGGFENGFTDVPEWAAGYVGYAFENGITKGISETEFDPNSNMTDFMFLTLTLRVLGYSDSEENKQFDWTNPYELAYNSGLIKVTDADNEFTRGDSISVFWNAIDAKLCGEEEKTLGDKLIENGVFTAEELEAAREVQENGRTENAGVPKLPGTDATAPESEDTTVPETTAPESEETTRDENATEEDIFDDSLIPGLGGSEAPTPGTSAPETTAPDSTGNEIEEDIFDEETTKDDNAMEEDVFDDTDSVTTDRDENAMEEDVFD